MDPRPIPGRSQDTEGLASDAMKMPAPPAAARARNSYIHADTLSPVDQNGSFAFDRVLKSGYLQKRTRKTKVQWCWS